MKIKRNVAFTLVEVLVFVSLISIIFVTVSYIISSDLRDARTNEYKIIGTHYADELKEWLSGEKETDWNAFIAREGSYCFDAIPMSWDTTSGIPCSTAINDSYDIFKRTVTLTKNSDSTQMSVHIAVTWNDGVSRSVTNDTVFAIWE